MEASSHHGNSTASTSEGRAPRLFDLVRGRMRRLGMARRTETAYLAWIRRFILANNKQHPSTMGAPEIEHFLTMLALQRHVAASTQNQALAALLFLYRQVLGLELPWMENILRVKKPQRLPVVLSRSEVSMLLSGMTGVTWLLAVQSRLVLWMSNKEFRSILAPGADRLQGRFMTECSLW